ncbi:50S ribosomal protein L4 [Candidatus Nitrosocosmicus franklandus]|uniref:50S ribosomal protein L4 n=1 Tax=Candidatus Nitrosocosmicus franklandianus TaxID=1798806 RepID=A0A484IDN6_9ARCH|nr:50S ribosomal protein L4 [Candidatus Nitrosocosmicus franklandus]VFJ15496.1 50S ribosomal protein L4 [Candidatus Nitrosocosmicus franklandus]
MYSKIFDLKGKELEIIELPPIFNYPYRPEVIKKAFVNMDTHHFQKQGRYPAAGEMVSAESRNTGLGIARIARAKGEGFSRAGQAAGVGGVRKGRLAHPPESWKVTYKKLNKKERILALYSAISCTSNGELIAKRGHMVEGINSFPIVLTDDVENINKTKNLAALLESLGLGRDVERVERSVKKRSGKAKRRGRPSRVGKSVLIVVGNQECDLLKLDDSLPGVSIKSVKDLSIIDLAPGARPIRLTLYSKSSLQSLQNKKISPHKLEEGNK